MVLEGQEVEEAVDLQGVVDGEEAVLVRRVRRYLLKTLMQI